MKTEEKILNILQQFEWHPSIRVMYSVLILHQDHFGRKSIASKFSHPLNTEFKPTLAEVSIFNNYGFRKIPLRAQRALVQWHQGDYPIQLLHHIPTPWQILEMQAVGNRCVSMDNSIGCLSRTYEGKNYFDFILHDLVHADHFFHHPQSRRGQIGFARLMLHLKSQKRLDFLEDTQFQKHFQNEFDYLISDMNSHPLHLILTLKSMLDRYFGDTKKSNDWLKHTFIDFPNLAESLIAKDRARSAHSLEILLSHKATEQFSLEL